MITFSYPGYNPTDSITLGSPERGDDESDLSEVFIHPTESGQYKSTIHTLCFGEYERTITITGMCQAEIESFKEFVTNSEGHYIRYTDYNGAIWITQITDDVINIANGPSGYEVTMTLLVWELT